MTLPVVLTVFAAAMAALVWGTVVRVKLHRSVFSDRRAAVTAELAVVAAGLLFGLGFTIESRTQTLPVWGQWSVLGLFLAALVVCVLARRSARWPISVGPTTEQSGAIGSPPGDAATNPQAD